MSDPITEEQEVPLEWQQALKAIEWLEKQRDKTDQFFSPATIVVGAKVPMSSVRIAFDNGGDLIEKLGSKMRFNTLFRIQQGIQEAIKLGMLIEVEPGRYSLTKFGKQYTQHQLMTDPQAQAFMRRLIQSG